MTTTPVSFRTDFKVVSVVVKGSRGLKYFVSVSDFVAVTCTGLICSKCHNQAPCVLMASMYIFLPFMTSMGHKFYVFTPRKIYCHCGLCPFGPVLCVYPYFCWWNAFSVPFDYIVCITSSIIIICWNGKYRVRKCGTSPNHDGKPLLLVHTFYKWDAT